MPGVEFQGLIQACLGLAEKLGVVAQDAREAGQDNGLAGGRFGGRELTLVEIRRLVDATLGRLQGREGTQGIGVVGVLRHRAFETNS